MSRWPRRSGVAELLAQIRDTALTTWRTDPSRLRQDANLEDDHARYHADRLVVELAQNAADAAAHQRPGRLLLRLTKDGRLLAANTGRALDDAGLRALTSLRASAKTTGVGRFGVGFAAVRSVADDIDIISRHGQHVVGARFSLRRTRAALEQAATADPALAEELTALHGQLPVLRLPFDLPESAATELPEDYDTTVILQLRAEAHAAVAEALQAVDDPLLLALPALSEVHIELPEQPVRRIARITDRWLRVTRSGTLDASLLQDRPVEERHHTGWHVTWAIPRDLVDSPAEALPPAEGVVYAPTPTRDELAWPAVLIATFPLDAARQHVAPGELTDELIAHAARLYAELLSIIAHEEGGGAATLALLPQGIAASELDARLRQTTREVLSGTPLLATATGQRLPPRHARAIDGPLGSDPQVLRSLAPLSGEFVVIPQQVRAVARELGVEFLRSEDVIESIPLTACQPAPLVELYDALAPYAGEYREVFALLPVLLADGRVRRGPRGTIAATTEGWYHQLDSLPIIDPQANHPLLRQLGAEEADPVGLLEHEHVVAALRQPGGVTAALHLAAEAAATTEAPLPAWLGELELPDTTGVQHPARSLVLPDSFAARVMPQARLVDEDLVARWGERTLRAVGVRAGLRHTIIDDVVADPAMAEVDPATREIAGWADYLAELALQLGLGTYVGEVPVIPDLADIAEDQWPQVLREIAGDPQLRAALTTSVAQHGPSYTAWWLREEFGAPLALTDTIPFMPRAPQWLTNLDVGLRRPLGLVTTLADLDAIGWDIYAGDWPEHGDLEPWQALAVWRGIAAAVRAGVELPAAAVLPAWHGERIEMRAAEDIVVAAPWWARVQAILPAPAELCAEVAAALDLVAAQPVTPQALEARRATTPKIVRQVLPTAPTEYWECDTLRVGDIAVDWWEREGEAWAVTTAGLARALAAAAGRWEQRHLVEQLLSDPDYRRELWLETSGDRESAELSQRKEHYGPS